jgi:hypothetical protein
MLKGRLGRHNSAIYCKQGVLILGPMDRAITHTSGHESGLVGFGMICLMIRILAMMRIIRI